MPVYYLKSLRRISCSREVLTPLKNEFIGWIRSLKHGISNYREVSNIINVWLEAAVLGVWPIPLVIHGGTAPDEETSHYQGPSWGTDDLSAEVDMANWWRLIGYQTVRTRALDQVLRHSRRGTTVTLRLGSTRFIDCVHSVSSHRVHYWRNGKSKPIPCHPWDLP